VVPAAGASSSKAGHRAFSLLLRQKAGAVKAFDDRLAKLGYQAKDGAGKPKKSHHKNPAGSPDAAPANGAAKSKS